MSLYPLFLQPYAPYITLVLFLVDGLIFGYAARASLRGVVLLFVGLIIADFIGLSIVAIVARGLLSAIVHAGLQLLQSVDFNSIVVTFGIVLWIVGFAIGAVIGKRR